MKKSTKGISTADYMVQMRKQISVLEALESSEKDWEELKAIRSKKERIQNRLAAFERTFGKKYRTATLMGGEYYEVY